MEERRPAPAPQPSRGRRQRASYVPPAANEIPPAAVMTAASTAVVGGGLWYVIGVEANSEIGWLALGIGFVVGAGFRSAGGRGAAGGALCAGLTLAAILGARWLAYGDLIDREIDRFVRYQAVTTSAYDEQMEDARLYARTETDEQLREFLRERDYVPGFSKEELTPEVLADFRANGGRKLQEFRANYPTYESLVEAVRVEAHQLVDAHMSFGKSFSMLLVIFAGAAVVTAGVVGASGTPRRDRRPVRARAVRGGRRRRR